MKGTKKKHKIIWLTPSLPQNNIVKSNHVSELFDSGAPFSTAMSVDLRTHEAAMRAACKEVDHVDILFELNFDNSSSKIE